MSVGIRKEVRNVICDAIHIRIDHIDSIKQDGHQRDDEGEDDDEEDDGPIVADCTTAAAVKLGRSRGGRRSSHSAARGGGRGISIGRRGSGYRTVAEWGGGDHSIEVAVQDVLRSGDRISEPLRKELLPKRHQVRFQLFPEGVVIVR